MARLMTCPRGHTFESATSADPAAACPVCRAGDLSTRAEEPDFPMSGDRAMGAGPATAPQFPGMTIVNEISPGVGGMGVVYKAREASLDRIVAVKTIKSRLETPEGLAFFQREARAAAKLDHPNILRIFRFSPEHIPPFYVMEFLEGRHLDRACRGRNFAYVAMLIEKVARALAYAHGKGVVHRDIKPANILVDTDDEPHIADFGVAGYFQDVTAGGQTSRATLVGTPAFIAPEVYEQSADVGPEIDVYGLGVTLYELLTGRSAFAGKSMDEVRAAVLRGSPPLPREIDPAVPEPLQRICLAAMEKDPRARYESASQLADDLRRYLDGREVSARPTRYQAELRGRLQNHLTDIHLWREQSLIEVRDMDRLARPYNALLESASPWLQLSRRFPWESVFLRLGGWLVLVSTVLWPAYYWSTLTRAQRVLAVGLPTLAMNGAGWLLRWRGSRVNSLIYLSTGALLLPLLASVVLTEYRLLPHAQVESRELFGAATEAISATPLSRSAQDYAPTNLQLTFSAALFCAYCATLLTVTRARVLSAWLAAGLYLMFSGCLLLCGLKQWVVSQHVARALLIYLGVAALFWLAAIGLDARPRTRAWAAVFFAWFALPAVILLSLLARFGAVEWLNAIPRVDDQTINYWLMADGVIYFAGGILFSRAKASYVRFWGAFLMLLVPIHLLSPTQILFDQPGHDLFTIGGAAVTRYEAASAILSTTLVVLGTRLRQPALVLPALVGLTVFLFRATERHFNAYRSWPLAVALTGVIAMAVALASLLLQARRRNEPMI